MSAAFDLDIYKAFMAECSFSGFEADDGVDDKVRGALLYICAAMAEGNYCDFQFTFEGEENNYYTTTRAYLDKLNCRPLLQPWLEDRKWSRRNVRLLKSKHAVTTALRPP